MNQDRKSALLEDIRLQQNTGFEAAEIRDNLLAKGYTPDEVAEVHYVTTQAPPTPKSGGREYLSILVSIFFIIRGAFLISNNRPEFGAVMIVLGIAGVIIKIVLLNKK